MAEIRIDDGSPLKIEVWDAGKFVDAFTSAFDPAQRRDPVRIKVRKDGRPNPPTYLANIRGAGPKEVEREQF